MARPDPKVMHETERASLATGLSTDFASSGAAVVVMRSDGTFLYVGEGFCELVGRTRAELVGLRADETGIASSAGRTLVDLRGVTAGQPNVHVATDVAPAFNDLMADRIASLG